MDRTLARTFVEGFEGAAIDRMSRLALSAPATEDEGDQSRLDRGYDRVIAALCKQLPSARVQLRLTTPIKSIRWQRGEVVVSDIHGGSWRARKTVITLPLGVLKAKPHEPGAISFVPALPEKQSCLARMEIGHFPPITTPFAGNFCHRSFLPPH